MPTLLLNNHTLTDVRPTVNVRQLSVCLAYVNSFPGPRATFGCEKRGHGLHREGYQLSDTIRIRTR